VTRNLKPKITIGVPAYNEEKDIEQVVLSILAQTGVFSVEKIYLAIDGCTDKTEIIAKKLKKKYSKIELIIKGKRRGKMAAINEIIALSKTDLIVIANADNLPAKNAISELLKKKKADVGLVGPKAVCLKSDKPNLAEKMTRILWFFHHCSALKNPKIVSFMLIDKRAVQKIYHDCPIDEPQIEAEVIKNGFKVVYAPKAKLYIKPVFLISEYFSRRRSIHFGYYKMRNYYRYQTPTMKFNFLLKMFIENFRYDPIAISSAAFFEITAKIFGYFDYLFKKGDDAIWVPASSSKGLKKC